MKFGDIDYFVHFKDVKKMGIDGKKNLFAEDDIIYRLIVLFRRENNNLRF